MASSRVNRFKDEFAAESVAPEDFLDSGGTSEANSKWRFNVVYFLLHLLTLLPAIPSAEQEAMIRKFVEQNASSNAWFQVRKCTFHQQHQFETNS